MNNFKKIGLTALAGSLVAATAYAGDMSVTGSASMKVRHVDGGAANAGKAFSMGNQLTFSGSGELDNGLNVSLSFVLDQGDDTNTVTAGSGTHTHGGTSPFDSHSVTISSDSLGSLKFAGEGGANVQTAIDTTAAGDLWDNGFGITAAQDPKGSASGDNMMSYTLPTLMDGVDLSASYHPKGSGAASSTAYAIAYTGVEGLTLNYATGSNDGTAGSESDTTTMKASYAYGPITVSYSENEFDGAGTAANTDQEVTSYEVAYTVSDAISISYGAEDIKTPDNASDEDMDISGVVASYTAGGMTITGTMISADNTAHGTADTQDKDEWSIAASFAF
jgi:outer membrane protein OmpU